MTTEEMLRTRAWEVAESPADLGYRNIPDWGTLPHDWRLGQVAGVEIDSEDRVYMFHRGSDAPPLICFDVAGKVLFSWDHIDFGRPHMVTCDADDNVWLVDDGAHVIYKLSPDGEVLSTLGVKGEVGSDGEHFDKPTDIAFNTRGEMYVSDGYGANMRVMKFDPDGEFMLDWGEPGEELGQFILPHAICVDTAGLVYVADRNMWRVQVFDPDGKFLTVWKHIGRPSDLVHVSDGHFFVCDAPNARVTKVTATGEVVGFFGEPGAGPGQMGGGNHGITFSSDGDIVLGNLGGRVQRFTRQPTE